MSGPQERQPAVPGRRRKRLPDNEIRSRVMEAGREVMDVNGGLTVSLEHLSFEEVIQRAAVSRSAAYRLWPSKIDFYDDLLLDLAGPDWAGAAAFDEDTTTLAHQIVDDHKEMLETEEGRLALVVKAARIGAEQNFQAVTASGQWRTYVVLTSTLVSMPEGETRDKLTQQMKEADDRFLERMATFYKEISARVGIRLRPEFGGDFKVLAALGASAVEGLGIRNLLTPELLGRTYESSYFAPYGEGRWSLASLGFTAILMTLVELDPAFDPRKSG